VYPIGRLDADYEGLLLLSDEARWNARLLSPDNHVEKIYHVLVERLPDESALRQLRDGSPMGAITPNMPDTVLAAASAALDPRLGGVASVQSDQNSIVLSGGIPGAGNTRFRS
jgi:pseudouridine synthase